MKVRLMERSIFSQRYCFLESLRERRVISDVEYQVLSKWFEFMTQKLERELRPDLIGKDSSER